MKNKRILLYILPFLLFMAFLLDGCVQSKRENYIPVQKEKPWKGLVTGRIYEELVTDSRMMDDFSQLGVEWIRIEFEEYMGIPTGATIQSPEVQENIKLFSQVIADAHRRNIKVLGVISLNSFSSKKVPMSEELIREFREAVKWHLDVYPVDAIEIWNEPSGFGFTPKQELKWYGTLLIDLYDNLKSAYPHVLFVAPATANAEAGEWIGRHYADKPEIIEGENSIFNTKEMRAWRDKNGNKLPLDIISWHIYGSGQADPLNEFYFGRDFRTYYEEILAYKDLDGRFIIRDYPIWVTEYGWTSNHKPGTGVSEEIQNKNFITIMNEFEKLPAIQNIFWYDYKDDENVPDSEGNAHGLIKNSTDHFERKPLYYSFLSWNTGIGLIHEKGNKRVVESMVKKYLEYGGMQVLGFPVHAESKSGTLEYASVTSRGLWKQYFKKGDRLVTLVYDPQQDRSWVISGDE